MPRIQPLVTIELWISGSMSCLWWNGDITMETLMTTCITQRGRSLTWQIHWWYVLMSLRISISSQVTKLHCSPISHQWSWLSSKTFLAVSPLLSTYTETSRLQLRMVTWSQSSQRLEELSKSWLISNLSIIPLASLLAEWLQSHFN